MRKRTRRVLMVAVGAFVSILMTSASGRANDDGSVGCPDNPGWTQLGAPARPLPARRPKDELLTVAAGWSIAGELWGGDWRGLHRSIDCGQSWELVRVLRPPENDYIPRLVFRVGTDALGRVYVVREDVTVSVTPDDGASWWYGSGYLERDTARPFQSIYPLDLAVSAGPEPIAYATVDQRNFRGRRGLWRSTDGGRRWEERHERSFVVWAVDPRDGEVVYGGAPGVLTRSTDGGGSFHPYAPLTCPDPISPEGAIKAMAITPDASRFWLATTTNEICRSLDQGLTWHRLDGGPPGGPIKQLAVDPFDYRSFYAVTEALDLWLYREPDVAAPIQLPITPSP